MMPEEIPPAWERLTFSAFSGVIMVIGAPDTGKSTFARYLYRRLGEQHERRAFLDGDMGQAKLGPPTTMTLALGEPGVDKFPPAGPRFRTFVGDISPSGHMLSTVTGTHRLVQKARERGATVVIVDTTGLVNPAHGGGALKWAKIDLLEPSVVVGFQREHELEYLLVPLRISARTRVIDRPVPQAAQRRDVSARRAHRAERFRHHFRDARSLTVDWQRLAIIPRPYFSQHRLVALEDRDGFTLGLGIITASDRAEHTITLYTPLPSMENVDAIRLGDLALHPETFRETRFQ